MPQPCSLQLPCEAGLTALMQAGSSGLSCCSHQRLLEKHFNQVCSYSSMTLAFFACEHPMVLFVLMFLHFKACTIHGPNTYFCITAAGIAQAHMPHLSIAIACYLHTLSATICNPVTMCFQEQYVEPPPQDCAQQAAWQAGRQAASYCSQVSWVLT